MPLPFKISTLARKLYCKENMRKMKENNPDTQFFNLHKILRQQWNKIGIVEKRKWEKLILSHTFPKILK